MERLHNWWFEHREEVLDAARTVALIAAGVVLGLLVSALIWRLTIL